jgi:Transposase DDE domain
MLFQTDPRIMAGELPSDAWATLTAGEGAKGPRLYYWARLPLGFDGPAGFERWVLIAKSLKDPDALAYYFAFCKTGTSLAELAGAAGARWAIEECFLRAKDDLGLDHCEARSWQGWHRHMTLVMIAAAFLVKLSADQVRHAFTKWAFTKHP